MRAACPCHTCRRIRELTAKRDRAADVLETGEGFISLNVYGSTGVTNTIRVEASDRDGLEEAIAMLEEDIDNAKQRIDRFGHGAGRRRRIRSRWMER